jgi:hypothetical protein
MRPKTICCAVAGLACLILLAAVIPFWPELPECQSCNHTLASIFQPSSWASKPSEHAYSHVSKKINSSKNLDEQGWELSRPENTSSRSEEVRSRADATQSNGPGKLQLLYFAITHHGGVQKALASDASWGRQVNHGRGILWYTSQYEPELAWQHVLPNRGGYWNMTYRVLAVYKHVYKHHPGYDWYALFWDDNYVFVENFEVRIESFQPKCCFLHHMRIKRTLFKCTNTVKESVILSD